MDAAKHSDTSGTPAGCPACKSADVVMASKTADASTYWRCRGCGEVWNAGRRQQTPVNRYEPPYRRY
jgi:transposase-like protein